MAIDKALYELPQGLDAIAQAQEIEPIEVDILDPVEEEIEVTIEDDFDENLAESMDQNDLAQICGDLIADVESDISSRKDWMKTYVDGLELLGMKIEERAEPWEGACGVYHPLLAEALVKFQAETVMETLPAAGPVKTQVIGKETPEKMDCADRVQQDMNYQITDVMVEFRPEHERMVWGLGLSGNAFKKVYFDPGLNRQVSLFVPAEDLIVPYGASNLETADRVTHVMRKTENEMRKLQVAGFYCDVDLGDPVTAFDEVEKKIAEKMGFTATSDDRYKVLEIQVNLDLPGYEDEDEDGNPTGIALPYIVTIEKGTQTVLAIRRNWRPEDENKQKRNHFVHYGYVPGFGFYCFGLIHLVGAFAKSGTSIIRQLVDAGTLSNLPGGFKTRGMRVKGDDTPIAPGEWRDVDVPSGVLKDNLLPLPYKEPSQVLYSLLGTIVEEGRRFASASDLKIADMSANTPVGTTLAILERTLKVMTAVQARVHYSMKQELKLLKDIIRDYCPDDYSYEPTVGNRFAKKADYDQVNVIPVSDPNAATMSQKVVQYQAVLQLAQQAPQLYNMALLHRQMLDVLGIKDAKKLIPLEDDKKPMDPVSENMAIMNMKPVKAFLYQDHQAHITIHMNAMKDPKIAAMIGQNPQAQAMGAAAMAHIQEHLAFEYRKQMEQMMGMPLPTGEEDEGIPKEIELQISQAASRASDALLQRNQTEVAAQQAQQAAQDPVIQMQKQELDLKQAEEQRKAAKDQADAQEAAARLEVERERIASLERIAGAQLLAKTENDQAKLKVDVMKDVFKQGQNQLPQKGNE
jgi:RNase P subunit RPR2